MRLVWRRVPPEGSDHELIWLLVSLTAAIGGAIWLGLGLPTLRCPFLAVTGYPCLTCGATRCSIAFLHGNFFGAWLWNPLAFVGLCGVVLFDLYAAIVLIARAPRLRLVDWRRTQKNSIRIAGVAVVLVNWIYLLAHRGRF
ncbi:MAG: DUF2752 domain-containing protein [Chthoniobacterales bacterium]